MHKEADELTGISTVELNPEPLPESWKALTVSDGGGWKVLHWELAIVVVGFLGDVSCWLKVAFFEH